MTTPPKPSESPIVPPHRRLVAVVGAILSGGLPGSFGITPPAIA